MNDPGRRVTATGQAADAAVDTACRVLRLLAEPEAWTVPLPSSG